MTQENEANENIEIQYTNVAKLLGEWAPHMQRMYEHWVKLYPLTGDKPTSNEVTAAVTVPVPYRMFVLMTTASALVLRDYGEEKQEDVDAQ